MSKIGIITITYGTNYGNRLQNYALQSVLSRYSNSKVITLDIEYKEYVKIKDAYLSNIYLLKQLIKRLLGQNNMFYQAVRLRRFAKFNAKFINMDSKVVTEKEYYSKDYIDTFDLFVCGSDQIWNTYFNVSKNMDKYLCGFANGKRVVSYAASFGTDHIKNEYIELFHNNLMLFEKISVRESVGASIIEKLCERKASIVLDPVLLIDKDEWIRLSRRPNFCSDDYILVYILGSINDSMKKHFDYIKEKLIAKEVIFLSGDNGYSESNRKWFCVSPDEFVWLVANAKCVLTDSFHCVAFSILFNKLFLTYERKTSNDNNILFRIEELLKTFDLMVNKDSIDNPIKIPSIYDEYKISMTLIEMRNRSMQFIDSFMNHSG